VSTADELRLLRDAIKNFPDALAVWSADGVLIACSDQYTRLAKAAPASNASLRRTVRRLEGGGSVELLADVSFLAYHDTLTGLPNRRLLDDRLRQAIHLAQRRDRMVALLLVHLDDFDHGDAVLREVAQRLGACVRKADTLARAGVDEFALVVCDLKDEADCRVVADKVVQALAGFAVSVGVSLYPADGGDGEALLRNADAAMHRAKQLGR
jgi:diguanylate cyclase (GGDEF)-like protein